MMMFSSALSFFLRLRSAFRQLAIASIATSYFLINFSSVYGQDQKVHPKDVRRSISQDLLSDKEWKDIEAAVDRGLAFLVSQQRADGSFQIQPTNDPGFPLCA